MMVVKSKKKIKFDENMLEYYTRCDIYVEI